MYEPCLCGADDCTRCRGVILPHSKKEYYITYPSTAYYSYSKTKYVGSFEELLYVLNYEVSESQEVDYGKVE